MHLCPEQLKKHFVIILFCRLAHTFNAIWYFRRFRSFTVKKVPQTQTLDFRLFISFCRCLQTTFMQSVSRMPPHMAHERNALISCYSYCKHLRIVVQIGLRNPFKDAEIISETEVSHQTKCEREMDIHEFGWPEIVKNYSIFTPILCAVRVKVFDAPNMPSTIR